MGCVWWGVDTRDGVIEEEREPRVGKAEARKALQENGRHG